MLRFTTTFFKSIKQLAFVVPPNSASWQFGLHSAGSSSSLIWAHSCLYGQLLSGLEAGWATMASAGLTHLCFMRVSHHPPS